MYSNKCIISDNINKITHIVDGGKLGRHVELYAQYEIYFG
jgi:hypothetical protein